MKEFLWRLQGDHKVFEKEYIFDEGLGESVKDHVEGIKKNFPGLEILVRRDRDGYPIIKTHGKSDLQRIRFRICHFHLHQVFIE